MNPAAPLPEVTVSVHPETPAQPTAPQITDPQAGGSGLRPLPPDDTVHLIVNGRDITGWERVFIIRGMERAPSSFDISMTERYPADPSRIDVHAGDPCQIFIGTTLVFTGYVDRRVPTISSRGSEVRIVGRSKVQDLVDCDVDPDKLPSMQIGGATALATAQKLAGQYGITVQQLGTGNPAILPQQNINLGETVWQVIEQITRYTAQLAYDEVDGSLNIASVGVGAMASGFAEGWNIERAQAMEAMDQRFSVIDVYVTSTFVFSEYGPMPTFGHATDDTVPRFRKLILVSPQANMQKNFGDQLANWEKARRYGRGQQCTLTCDSWRDSAGTLWHLNCFAPLNAPHLKLVNLNWIISQVTFHRDETGTHADVVMMPKEAFQPEPIILFPSDAEIGANTPPGGGSATPDPAEIRPASGAGAL